MPKHISTAPCKSVSSRVSVSGSRLTLLADSLGDATSGSVDFPSLTYLSLYHVSGLKPYINAPHLVTYHESRRSVRESFPAPVRFYLFTRSSIGLHKRTGFLRTPIYLRVDGTGSANVVKLVVEGV